MKKIDKTDPAKSATPGQMQANPGPSTPEITEAVQAISNAEPGHLQTLSPGILVAVFQKLLAVLPQEKIAELIAPILAALVQQSPMLAEVVKDVAKNLK